MTWGYRDKRGCRGRPAGGGEDSRPWSNNARVGRPGSRRWAIERPVAAEQLAVNLREFLQPLPKGLVSLDAVPGQGLLRGRLEQKLAHLACFETRGQIVERPMSLAARTAAVGLAAGGEALDERGAEQVRRNLEGTQQPIPALTQREGRPAAEIEYLSHLLGQEYQARWKRQEKDFAATMRISSTPWFPVAYLTLPPHLPESLGRRTIEINRRLSLLLLLLLSFLLSHGHE